MSLNSESRNDNIPLVGNALKVCLVLWVGLHAQADCEDKLANGRREAGEECVEGLWWDIVVSKTIIPSNPPGPIAREPISPPSSLPHREEDRCTHKVASNHAVRKLQHAHGDQEDEESIEQLHALRRLVDVLVPDAHANLLHVLCAAHLAAGAGGGFVGGASGLAGGGGDDGCGFGCGGRDGRGRGSGGDLFGSHFVWFVSCLMVVVKHNGSEWVVASSVRRSFGRSLATTSSSWLPSQNAPGYLRVIRRRCCMTREAEVFHHQWMASKQDVQAPRPGPLCHTPHQTTATTKPSTRAYSINETPAIRQIYNHGPPSPPPPHHHQSKRLTHAPSPSPKSATSSPPSPRAAAQSATFAPAASPPSPPAAPSAPFTPSAHTASRTSSRTASSWRCWPAWCSPAAASHARSRARRACRSA